MPNPLSWYIHWLPHPVHAAGVVVYHVVELVVPFAAVATILFESALIVSGNLAFLNWLTIVLSIPVIGRSMVAVAPGCAAARPRHVLWWSRRLVGTFYGPV